MPSYGLTTPNEQVKITRKDGKVQTLLVGDDTPTGSGAYAKVDNDPRVFTIASYVKTSLDKTSKDLRDKRLLTFNSDKLTRVDLTAKGSSVEFGKNNQNEWQILKPRPLARRRPCRWTTGPQAQGRQDGHHRHGRGRQESRRRIFHRHACSCRRRYRRNGTQQIEVRKDKDKNYYARSCVVEGIYKVASDVGDGLDKGLGRFPQ